MATQGILSIVDEGGEVAVKVVTGSEGAKIPELAKEIRWWPNSHRVNIIKVYEAAERIIDAPTLVVMDSDGCVLRPESDFSGVGPLHKLYYEKFNFPNFNPRWDRGTADYVEIVQLTTK